MPASSVAARSLALVLLGLVSASAMAQNVTAFNPYNGIGLPGSPAPSPTPQALSPLSTPPSPGMAFNPWRPAGVAAGWGQAPAPPPAYATYQGGYQGGGSYSYLPAPPPGPIESRIVAIPERGERVPTPGRPSQAPPTPPVTVTPTPPPAVAIATPPPPAKPPTPEPVPLKRQPAAAAPPPEATPAAPVATAPPPPAPPPPASTPTPPPQTTAAIAPPPLQPTPPAQVAPAAPRPPPAGSAMASVQFARESAEISGEARSELDRIAATLNSQKQVEVRAYATGPDAADARKIALARALAVRSYLIDKGVKTRIEVGAFASESRGPGSERVDILSPGGG